MGRAHPATNIMPADRVPVALVQMPFATTSWPSLGLGLLKSALSDRGIAADVHYLNFGYEGLVGRRNYTILSNGDPQNADLVGEWVFSAAAGVGTEADPVAYFDEVVKGGDPHHRKRIPRDRLDELIAMAHDCRDRVPAFLDDCLKTIDWSSYRIVGFTSTFQQHTASLALARAIKRAFPATLIVFGGANCEGEMGLATLRAMPIVDAVCTGEGDIAFPNYVAAALSGDLNPVPGIARRDDLDRLASDGTPSRAGQTVLDELPYPNYDDYFDQRTKSGVSEPCRILFESSRGCWWGQKSHCTFCGLNGQGIAFRHKSAARALDELKTLTQRYRAYTSRVSATDNIIPYTYFDGFLQDLAAEQLDLDIFYETKANLTKKQIALYVDAGLNMIQPGIESLQTDVLKIMRKGVNALQNIRLLKWCVEFGIEPRWNYLYGFPGEAAASYRAAADLIPLLTHLPPPDVIARLRFDRFSPFVERPECFGISDLRPYPAYRHVYADLTEDSRRRLAYYFVARFDGDDAIASYVADLELQVSDWQTTAEERFLTYFSVGNTTIVLDGRGQDARKLVFVKLAARIFELSDDIINDDALVSTLVSEGHSRDEARALLQRLHQQRLLVSEHNAVLSLPVPLLSRMRLSCSAMRRLRSCVGMKEEEDDLPYVNIEIDA